MGTVSVFSLAVQNPNAITERESAVADRANAMEFVPVVQEPIAKSPASWTSEKIHIIGNRE